MKAFCFVLLLVSAAAFSPKLSVKSLKTTALPAATMSYDALMQEARQCAFSPTNNPDEARRYLFEVLHVQSGCVSGELTGESVCENADEVAEIVAHLREKIHHQPLRRSVSSALATSLLFSAFCLASIVASQSLMDSVSSTPITLQEWQWAIRDQYLPNLIRENIQYGGLMTLDDASVDTVLPIQMQEIIWSVRDGYFNQLVAHYVKNGGL